MEMYEAKFHTMELNSQFASDNIRCKRKEMP